MVAAIPAEDLLSPSFQFTMDEYEADVTKNEPLTDLENDEVSPGSLFASGLIAAGGLVGLLGVATRLLEGVSESRGGSWHLPRFSETNPLHHDPFAVLMFALLAGSLFYFARMPLKEK